MMPGFLGLKIFLFRLLPLVVLFLVFSFGAGAAFGGIENRWAYDNFSLTRNPFNPYAATVEINIAYMAIVTEIDDAGQLLVGNLTGDERLEIAVVKLNRLSVYDSGGNMLWTQSLYNLSRKLCCFDGY